jgi:hypothetical protein
MPPSCSRSCAAPATAPPSSAAGVLQLGVLPAPREAEGEVAETLQLQLSSPARPADPQAAAPQHALLVPPPAPAAAAAPAPAPADEDAAAEPCSGGGKRKSAPTGVGAWPLRLRPRCWLRLIAGSHTGVAACRPTAFRCCRHYLRPQPAGTARTLRRASLRKRRRRGPEPRGSARLCRAGRARRARAQGSRVRWSWDPSVRRRRASGRGRGSGRERGRT